MKKQCLSSQKGIHFLLLNLAFKKYLKNVHHQHRMRSQA